MTFANFKASDVVAAMTEAHGAHNGVLRTSDKVTKAVYLLAIDAMRFNGPDAIISLSAADNLVVRGCWPSK